MTPAPVPPHPRAVACTLTGAWEADQPHELALVPRGKPFAKFSNPDSTKLTLASAAFVELTWKQLVATGVVAGDKLILHAAHPMLLAGYIAPSPRAVLRWAGGSAVEPELPAWIHPLGPTRSELACNALSLDNDASFQVRSAIATPTVREVMLAAGVTVPLSLTVDGSPVAELHYEAGDGPMVDVLEERDGRARVVVLPHHSNRDWEFAFVGWVASNQLAPHDHGFGGSWGSGGGIGLLHPRPTRSVLRLSCSHPVEIIGELEGEQHPLGTLSPDVTFLTGPAEGDLVPIWMRELPLELVHGARILVASASIADCIKAP